MTIANDDKIGATNDNVLVFGTRDLKYAHSIDGLFLKIPCNYASIFWRGGDIMNIDQYGNKILD
jgi:hypothetical protein